MVYFGSKLGIVDMATVHKQGVFRVSIWGIVIAPMVLRTYLMFGYWDLCLCNGTLRVISGDRFPHQRYRHYILDDDLVVTWGLPCPLYMAVPPPHY